LHRFKILFIIFLNMAQWIFFVLAAVSCACAEKCGTSGSCRQNGVLGVDLLQHRRVTTQQTHEEAAKAMLATGEGKADGPLSVGDVGKVQLIQQHAQHRGRTGIIEQPISERFSDIVDTEINETDLEFVQLEHFPVQIAVYSRWDYISEELKKSAAWDTEAVNFLIEQWDKHGSIGNILDVGANLGSYSMPLAEHLLKNGNGKGELIAVEAMPEIGRHFLASMQVNSLYNIRLYQYAVGAADGNDTVLFTENPVNEANSHMSNVSAPSGSTDKEIAEPLVIPLTTLDMILSVDSAAMQRVFAMKIDIEGSESMALKGGSKFLEQGPCGIWIELLYNRDEVQEILESYGYKMQLYEKMEDNAWYEKADMDECVSRLKQL